jgi:hypothetical protein
MAATQRALTERLESQLLLYTLAASAALLMPCVAQAEVVFTPSSAALHGIGNLAIDLDNDGTVDVTIRVGHCNSFSGYQKVGCISAYGASRFNQIEMSGFPFTRAAALPTGTTVDASSPFRVRAFMGTGFGSDYYGHWSHVANRFLGVKFVINGQVHFGWIGFRSVYGARALTAKLAGWAYETIPDTLIVTGRVGTSAQPTASIHPTSMELLAAGHTAIDQRRKRTPSPGGS